MWFMHPEIALRAHFAGLALQGLVSRDQSSQQMLARDCWAMAQTMVECMPDELKRLHAQDCEDYGIEVRLDTTPPPVGPNGETLSPDAVITRSHLDEFFAGLRPEDLHRAAQDMGIQNLPPVWQEGQRPNEGDKEKDDGGDKPA